MKQKICAELSVLQIEIALNDTRPERVNMYSILSKNVSHMFEKILIF